MKKTTRCLLIVAIVLVVIILGTLFVWRVMIFPFTIEGRMRQFNIAVSLAEQVEEGAYDYYERSKDDPEKMTKEEYKDMQERYTERISTLIGKAGLQKAGYGEISDEEFLAYYESLYPMENLIRDIYKIKYALDCGWGIERCACYDLYDLMKTLLSSGHCEQIHLDASLKGKIGQWYVEHPDAQPQQKGESTISGTMYDYENNRVYESSRTNDGNTIVYYGDFAYEYEADYNYDEGEYGWKNGEFRDTPSSWSLDKYERVYYKGFCVSMTVNGKQRYGWNIYRIGSIEFAMNSDKESFVESSVFSAIEKIEN